MARTDTRSEVPIVDPPKPPPEADWPMPTQARADAARDQALGVSDDAGAARAVLPDPAPSGPPEPSQEAADAVRIRMQAELDEILRRGRLA